MRIFPQILRSRRESSFFVSRHSLLVLFSALCFAVSITSAVFGVSVPLEKPKKSVEVRLDFVAAPEMQPLADRLARVDGARIAEMVRLFGLQEPGPPIRVELAREGSDAARLAPSWAVAYAIGTASRVVLIPNRVPSYPDRDLEAVLEHEIAHVLIARAAGRRPVPRWLNEGLAMVVSRDWNWDDRRFVLWASWRRGGSQMRGIDRRFQAGASEAQGAYALSGAFVRDLITRYGEETPRLILADLAAGVPFETAFQRAVGLPLDLAEERFWGRLDLWNRWIPLLGSSTTLWFVITLLSLWAFRRRRDRDREIRERWLAEEEWLAAVRARGPVFSQGSTEAPPDGWVN